MKKKLRISYLIIFILLLATEVCIALLVHDNFVRPYIGDVLVVGVICAFLRVFIPDKIRVLPLITSMFAVLVEILQYFDFVKLLRLSENRFFSILLGRTFDIKDILCYVAGGLIFFAAEAIIFKRRKADEY